MVKAIIVDDEPAVAEIIRYFIEEKNLPLEVVGVAGNGRQAIDLIDKTSPKIVFLDIQMPLMDGFEVMQARPDMQYIIITAYESFRYAQRALRLGAKDIILKPVEYEQLENAVTKLLGWRITNSDIVNDILGYVHTNYADKIELNRLAEEHFVASSYLARLFKKYVGVNLISYVNEVRIKNAKMMLDEGRGSVKEVAEWTGYDSLNNFYKYFKLYVGETPAAYCKKKEDKLKEQ